VIRAALVGSLACALGLGLPVPQAPDEGWGVAGVKPREVRRIYWDLLETTEVVVRVIPIGPDGKPIRVNLLFQAFFPGRERRDWNTGLPQWPKGPPARLTVTAQAFALTFVIPALSLRLLIDGTPVDLTGPGGRYRNIPCLITTDDCTPNGVEADLDPRILASVIAARSVQGKALGFPFELLEADREVLREFAGRIDLTRN
jgi:hypothetical protein